MPSSVIIALGIESALIVLSVLFLAQPQFIFSKTSVRIRRAARWSGALIFAITFCWSIIVGIILSMNGMVLRV